MLDGGHLVAEMLKREKIDVVFTLCGGHIMPIYSGLIDEGIRIIDFRHEQAAAHAADAYARLTRKPGVAMVTAGVGTPFAIAAKLVHSKSNVIVINGDGAFGLNGFEFDMAVRFNLPVVSVIGNDAAWGQIRGPQMNFYGANLKDCFASLAMTVCKSKIDKRKSESIN